MRGRDAFKTSHLAEAALVVDEGGRRQVDGVLVNHESRSQHEADGNSNRFSLRNAHVSKYIEPDAGTGILPGLAGFGLRSVIAVVTRDVHVRDGL